MNNFIQDAQIEGVKAQGEAIVRQIQAATGDPKQKAIAIAKAIVSTQQAIVKIQLGDK